VKNLFAASLIAMAVSILLAGVNTKGVLPSLAIYICAVAVLNVALNIYEK
jgi:hypothetical protein